MAFAQDIHIRLDDHFGDTVIATATLLSLMDAFSHARLHVYTAHQDLILGLPGIHALHDAALVAFPNHNKDLVCIDLRGYVDQCDPQHNLPYRHLTVHQLEAAEADLGKAARHFGADISLTNLSRQFAPKIIFSKDEESYARQLRDSLAGTMPLACIQTRTGEDHKNWPDASWQELQQLLPMFAFVDLHQQRFPLRVAAALMATGIVISPDSFSIHAAKAGGCRDVVGLMVTSEPEVVGYAGQIMLGGPGQTVQPKAVAEVAKHMLKQNKDHLIALMPIRSHGNAKHSPRPGKATP